MGYISYIKTYIYLDYKLTCHCILFCFTQGFMNVLNFLKPIYGHFNFHISVTPWPPSRNSDFFRLCSYSVASQISVSLVAFSCRFHVNSSGSFYCLEKITVACCLSMSCECEDTLRSKEGLSPLKGLNSVIFSSRGLGC